MNHFQKAQQRAETDLRLNKLIFYAQNEQKEQLIKEINSSFQDIRKAVIKDVRDMVESHMKTNTYDDAEKLVFKTTLNEVLTLLTKHQALNKVGKDFGNAIKKLGA